MASSTSRTHAWQTNLAGKWSDIGDASLQDALEASFLANSEGHRFTEDCWTYEVDFERMNCSLVFCKYCGARRCSMSTLQESDVRRVPDPRVSSASRPAVVSKTTPSTPVAAPPLAALPKVPKLSTVTAATPAQSKASRGCPSTPAASAPPKATRTHAWQTRLAGRWSNIGDASLQDALEASFLANSEGHRFTARGYTYEVDFGCMKQVNMSTKRKRSVQRVPDARASLASMAAVVPKTAPATGPPPNAPAAPIATATSIAAVPKMSKVTTAATTRPAKSKAGGGSTPAATVPKAPMPSLKASRGGVIRTGRVKTILKEKGFGFILVNDEEVFFHASIPGGTSIQVNDIVEVEVFTDGSGRQRAKQVLFLRKGSIFKTMCKNKCCVANGDRHFADLCPLATSVPAPVATAASKPAVAVAAKQTAAAAPKRASAASGVSLQNRFMMFADDSDDEDKHDGDSQDGGASQSTACS